MTATNDTPGEAVTPAASATRSGRWGIRQIDRHGDNTGGGTVGVGWATREEAEQANPPMADFTFEPFERWSDVDK